MELYIIRHGDPDYANDTLTEKGWEQAKLLAPRMAALNPVAIFCSPRKRAQDTAKPALELLHMDFTVEDWMNESMDYMQSLTDDIENYDDYGYRFMMPPAGLSVLGTRLQANAYCCTECSTKVHKRKGDTQTSNSLWTYHLTDKGTVNDVIQRRCRHSHNGRQGILHEQLPYRFRPQFKCCLFIVHI